MKRLDGFKILQIVKGIDIGGNSGGAEKFGIQLARALNENGMDVSICAFFQFNTTVENYWQSKLTKDGIHVFYANPSRKLNFFEARNNIRNWLMEHPIDIVHCHYQIGTIISTSLKYSNLYQLLIRTAHIDMEFGDGISGIVSRLAFQNIVYPLFIDCEVGVSKSIAQRLNQQIIRRMLHKSAIRIPNAIPMESESGSLESNFEKQINAQSVKPWFVTAIGILVSRKNFDLLIRAMAKVIDQIPNAQLVIAGDGPEYSNLVNISKKLKINSACLFLGQQQNVIPILKKSDIFVLPSSAEGISTVILEAMQNDVPVIASDISGNRELIQNGINGFLVPLGDEDALAVAIIHAYHHPEELLRLTEEAHRRISEFSLVNVCDKYINLYVTLMHSK